MSITDLTLNVASICNLALSHLGQKATITNLDTDYAANKPAAIAITNAWGPCRNDVFREFKWPFANVIYTMIANTSVTSDHYPEWEYFYEYTANAATIWYVFDSSTVEEKEEQEFEVVYNPILAKRLICCNLTGAMAEITYNVTAPEIWDPKFVMAFSFKLASMICMSLTGDEKKTLTLINIYNAYISEAKRIAAQEKKKKPHQSNPIASSRG